MHIEDESVYCGKQVTLIIIHVCRIEKPLEFQYQSKVNERVPTISTQPWEDLFVMPMLPCEKCNLSNIIIGNVCLCVCASVCASVRLYVTLFLIALLTFGHVKS